MLKSILVFVITLATGSAAFAVNKPTTQQVAVDLSTPQAAVISYLQSLQANDAPSAKDAVIRTDKVDQLIDVMIAERQTEQRYMEAAKKKYGDEAFHRGLVSMLIAEVKKANVPVEGIARILSVTSENIPAARSTANGSLTCHVGILRFHGLSKNRFSISSIRPRHTISSLYKFQRGTGNHLRKSNRPE
jgi:hypothetical protein